MPRRPCANVLLSVGGGGVGGWGRARPGNARRAHRDPHLGHHPWLAGAPIPVLLQARLSADAVVLGDGDVSMDVGFFGSLDWLEITSVTDDAGLPVASFSALSPEGLDWAVPLPEPGAGVLLRLAVSGLAVRWGCRPARADGRHRD